MTRGPTARISSKLAACMAGLALAVTACQSSSVKEESASTGSEFQQGDQEDVEVVEVVEDTTVGNAASMNLKTVYFAFDRSDIQLDARALLKANGQQLEGGGAAVRLEGHADERGDEEYNLALGERRAGAVKRYLTDLGVPGSKIRTVSYGEAKPAVAGHNEAAWRYNRRVEFHGRP